MCVQAYNANDEIKDANNYPMIRLFTADLKSATTPQPELLSVEQPWSVASSSEWIICSASMFCSASMSLFYSESFPSIFLKAMVASPPL